MKGKLIFKSGDRVAYILVPPNVMFSGTIIDAKHKKGLKPYTIKTDDDEIRYANEQYVIAEKVN